LKEAYEEIEQIGSKIRLTPSTKFLAYYLTKHFLAKGLGSGEEKLVRQDLWEVSHCAIFLASKMRERDIYCPMISHMLMAGNRNLR
jgi:hypothetical protein